MAGARGVLKAVEDLVGADWKKARCVVAEMVHFVNQLQYYILFEVSPYGLGVSLGMFSHISYYHEGYRVFLGYSPDSDL